MATPKKNLNNSDVINVGNNETLPKEITILNQSLKKNSRKILKATTATTKKKSSC